MRIAIAPLLLLGCAADPVAAIDQATTQDNGRSLNGRSLNGRSLNGRPLNGRNLNGVSLDGARLDGVSLDGMWLHGSALHAVTGAGRELGPRALARAELRGLLDDGTTLALRIDAVDRDRAPAAKDVWRYVFSFAADGGRAFPCGRGNDGKPITAIALAGRWDYRSGVPGGGAHVDDPDAFTFACDGHALAKCVEMGYAPWREARACHRRACKRIALAAHHQACTRALRADYCGDGSAHTVDGTVINLHDGLGIQRDTEAWRLEAEWDPAGAVCLSAERLADASTVGCAAALAGPGCGNPAHFAAGALIITEF